MSKKKTSSQPEILFKSDLSGRGPVHAQVEHAIREAVRSGRLRLGLPLPSTRVLARDLGVSRGVIVEAYEQLIAEGYLVARARSRTVVAAGASTVSEKHHYNATPQPNFDFRPGLPDLSLFPRHAWVRSLRRTLNAIHPAQLSYSEPQGDRTLREGLCDYLGRVRGVLTRPGQVVICNGIAQALVLISQALQKRGISRIAVEDPCQPDLIRIVSDVGLIPVGVPVDEDGIKVDLLERMEIQAVVITPAHQFPTGTVLIPERRKQLVDWAVRNSAFIIEDDYDAEYRYDRAPVGAIQGLAPERVIYTGSLSKILAPALRIGWIIIPAEIYAAIEERKKNADLMSPILQQLAFADFLREGELDRHLRRMRGFYRRRRDALIGALARHFPDWRPMGVAAGLHLVAKLPPGSDEQEIARLSSARSVRLYPMRQYGFKAASEPALVFGYGSLSESQIRRGISQLAAALR
ncbi:MAG TPA: PLP-dependent aminotransferase family protein [Pyrinomonadaceae bacterium]|nr:PLP-dependent aminotransferase family protein [Pyrinomonadaceae bacterium]